MYDIQVKRNEDGGLEANVPTDGFGDLNSGVLAFCILVHAGVPAEVVWRQERELELGFKHDFIEPMPFEGGVIPWQRINEWLANRNIRQWERQGVEGPHFGHHLYAGGLGEVHCLECDQRLSEREGAEAWPES